MISDSKFNMWRCVFAIAHADGVVTEEEQRFMKDVLQEVPFSLEQRNTLLDDISKSQDIVSMYQKISDEDDRNQFFKFAKTMVWIDGDYGMDEQAVMTQLQRLKVMETNVDHMIGHVDLELDEERGQKKESGEGGIKEMIYSFKEAFNKKLSED